MLTTTGCLTRSNGRERRGRHPTRRTRPHATGSLRRHLAACRASAALARRPGAGAGDRTIGSDAVHVVRQLRFHKAAYGGFYLARPTAGSVGDVDLDTDVARVLGEHVRSMRSQTPSPSTRRHIKAGEEDRCVDLVGDPEWPQDKIATRLRQIRDERSRLARQLGQSTAPTFDQAAEAIRHLLTEPRDLYRQAGQRARQALNRAFYDRVHLDAADDGPHAANEDPADLVTPLIETAKNPGLLDPGSSKQTMVELRGFEPLNALDLRKHRDPGRNTGPPGRTVVGGCWRLTLLFRLCFTGFLPDDLDTPVLLPSSQRPSAWLFGLGVAAARTATFACDGGRPPGSVASREAARQRLPHPRRTWPRRQSSRHGASSVLGGQASSGRPRAAMPAGGRQQPRRGPVQTVRASRAAARPPGTSTGRP